MLLSELSPGRLNEQHVSGSLQTQENDTRIKQSQMARPLSRHPCTALRTAPSTSSGNASCQSRFTGGNQSTNTALQLEDKSVNVSEARDVSCSLVPLRITGQINAADIPVTKHMGNLRALSDTMQ